MTNKPIIGITLDFSEGGGFSQRPYYAVRTSYFDVVSKAGGVPIAIPFEPSHIERYLEMVDGLLIPGGDFALKDDWYIDNEGPAFPVSPRLEFDIQIIKKALAREIPLLGVCAGMQSLAAINGAKLSSTISNFSNRALNHLDEIAAESYAHSVTVKKGSLLHKIVDVDSFEVNSRHREGVVETPDNVIVTATADDGVIEAIEIAGKDFALGVQWHPEFFNGDKNFEIIKALVSAASK